MGDTFEQRLRAARAGDDWAVEALYREMHPRLLRYVGAREYTAAEDITAEVWLAVAQGLHRFEGNEQQFRAWLFSIARRRIADYRRQRIRRRTEPVTNEHLDSVDTTMTTEDLAVEHLNAAAVARFVAASLPLDQAEVILLRVLADLDVEHVAALLNKRPGTVRVLQHRALQRLRRATATKAVTR
jgi:RNA polymerase sigma-70 factor (ECF subfamily)